MPTNDIARRVMEVSAVDLDRTAIAAPEGRTSYRELRHAMLSHAGWLGGTQGVAPGERVAICLPKTLDTVQLIFGVLAAGAAYVPLQFQGPPERLGRILAALQPKLLLTTRDMAAALQADGAWRHLPIVSVDETGASFADLGRGSVPRKSPAEVSADDLATIFFTSGSTGEPKGVMWSQRGMAAAIAALPRWRQQTSDDRLIGVAPLHYSAGAEIFYPVFSRASIHLCTDREVLFADRLAQVLEEGRITIWSATATALRMLVESGDLAGRDLRSLRRVEIYGERMAANALRAAMAALPDAVFLNLYAASEAFDMIEYEIPRRLDDDDVLPLGWPSPTYELSLRDDESREVKPGATGEICVVGPAVTVGYWNDPALSEARRLPGVADSYRTGDLAVRGSDGLYRLVGRRDHLIKLRGHRLDLGEIEAAARSDARVREAVAFVLESEQERGIIALAVLSDVNAQAMGELEEALNRIFAARLPAFARPAHVALLADFPRLSSGKVDRRTIARLAQARWSGTD